MKLKRVYIAAYDVEVCYVSMMKTDLKLRTKVLGINHTVKKVVFDWGETLVSFISMNSDWPPSQNQNHLFWSPSQNHFLRFSIVSLDI